MHLCANRVICVTPTAPDAGTAAAYAEALRAVEGYLEGPYRIRRGDGSTEQRSAITTGISDVKSRINCHRDLLPLHAEQPVADAYEAFVQAAVTDGGGQMTEAWGLPPTPEDRQVPLGVPFDRRHADTAKAAVLTAMKRGLERRWWRPRRP